MRGGKCEKRGERGAGPAAAAQLSRARGGEVAVPGVQGCPRTTVLRRFVMAACRSERMGRLVSGPCSIRQVRPTASAEV